MKVWLVTKIAENDPLQRVYILGAHSSRDDAIKHRKQAEDPSQHATHLIELDVDKRQSPVLVGVAVGDDPGDCKHNLPNG